MKRRFRVVAVALGALLGLCVAPSAMAFCRATTNRQFVATPEKPCDDVGLPLFWRSSCVGYDLQKSGGARVPLADAQSIAAAAFAAWAGASCPADTRTCSGPPSGHPSISGVDLGPVACDRVEYNPDARNANVIVFRDADWPHPDQGEIALTTVHFDNDTGEIYDVDIEINGRLVTANNDAAAVDLQSVLTHETGHFFGLAHTQPDQRGVMRAGYFPGSINRALFPDDVCGICAAYPPARAAPCSSTPRHGFSGGCRGDSDNPVFTAVVPDVGYAAGGGGCSFSPVPSWSPGAPSNGAMLLFGAMTALVCRRVRARRTESADTKRVAR